MFKNTLFLKIIMVFTLPALGILYFSSVLVFEKIDFLDEVYKTEYNLQYVKITEKLIHSLQKERGLSVSYEENDKYREKLEKQTNASDLIFQDYLEFVNKTTTNNNYLDNLRPYIKDIQNNFYNLKNLRSNVKSSKVDVLVIIHRYTKINELLLNSISSIKLIKSALNFNNELLNAFYFLVYKEYCGIERALVSVAINKNKIDEKIEKELLKTQLMQSNSLNYFEKNASIKVLKIYNDEMTNKFEEKEGILKLNILGQLNLKNLTLPQWWDYSTKRIDKLDLIFEKMILDLNQISQKLQKKAFIEQNISLFFLFVSFTTLISLLFVLKSIIYKEQKTYDKIEKQKKVYELLNETNKYLLKNDRKEELYSQINKIISRNQNMVFSFIYDLEKENINNRVFAQECVLKDILLEKLDELEDESKVNLLNRTIKWKTNVSVKNFQENNISIFYKYADRFNIKSAAAFPIKKFDEIVSVLLIYSNENKFFDYEVEILFDKMINDLTHALEKIDYEKIRLHQEKDLKISSVAFESSEPMLITDDKAQIVKVNHAFCEVMGYSKEELLGQNPRIFKSQHQKNEFYISLWSSLVKNDSWRGEVYNVKHSGEIIPVRVTITAIRDKYNNITNYLAQYIDISEQKDRQQILEYQATHDNLTALPNRLLLLDRIEHAITKVIRHNIIGGLIFIDLDNFKEINDTLGHDVGDTLLITVAKQLREVVRDEDTISRIGGDEFIILADNIGSDNKEARDNIEILAKKVKKALNDIKYIDGYKNISTPSIGVTLFNDSSVSVKDIIKQADTAMYAAKKQGKNTIEFFN